MSVFRKHKTSADRSAKDRRRHRHKIEKALREGIYHVIADESIIGRDGKTRVKIPVRGIKEYRFIYGDNQQNKQVGSTPGKDRKKGEILGQQREQGKGDKAGNEAGEEMYEVEITLDELAAYLFDDLELPDLEKKQLLNIVDESLKRKGYRNQGIRPRLDKKETLKRKLKRKAAAKRMGTYTEPDEESEEEGDGFSFNERDLRYRHVEAKPKETANAVIFFVMDVSGSMSKEKKYLSRSFFFLLYQFLRYRYENVEIVFIAHTTDAKEVSEDEFFTRRESGGTFISPAIKKVTEIAFERYHPNLWNIYAFHCSDGDNWGEDTEKAVAASRELKEIAQMYCYCEVVPVDESPVWLSGDFSTQMTHYLPLVGDSFKVVKLAGKDDIWPSFKKIFGGRLGV